mmetsp:Transcript_48142/g.95335  ORF Transcript_48142/g.95335 Transcript_48142/m.95335 type:complete len:98 (-) Transcript_48142:109-402(-)
MWMERASSLFSLFRDETATVWFTKFCHRCPFPGGNELRRRNLEAKQFPLLMALHGTTWEGENMLHGNLYLKRCNSFVSGFKVMKGLYASELKHQKHT